MLGQTSSADWRELYRNAIQERNRNLLPQKVAAAENAMLKRGRELLHSRKIEELETLDDCLYALKAYKSAWSHAEAGPRYAGCKDASRKDINCDYQRDG